MTAVAVLEPAMPAHDQPCWEQARWIGMLDLDTLDHDTTGGGVVEFVAADAAGYRYARILVRRHRRPVAFCDVALFEGRGTLTLPPNPRPRPGSRR